MKKLLLFTLLIIGILTGCSSAEKKVINGTLKTYQEPLSFAKVDILTKDFKYDSWNGEYQPRGIQLEITNITSKPLNIIWEESSLNNGVIFKDGMKYIDAGKTPPKLVLFPNSKQTLIIYPSNSVEYVSGQYGGWEIKGFEENEFPIKIILTFEQDGVKDSYIGEVVR